MIEPVLLLSGVTLARRLVQVSLALVPGEAAGLVGPAGAGKSTLLRIIAGLTAPDAGTVTVAGRPAGTAAARRVVGYAPAASALPEALTVREVLGYVARLQATSVKYAHYNRMVARALALTDAGGLADRRVGTLSAGERRRLALAQAVVGDRCVILLDETLSGLDPVARRELRGVVARLAASGMAVLIAATDPVVLEPLVARAFVLRAGRIVRAGALGPLVQERVLEVILDRPPAEPPPGFRITASGVEAPLAGRTAESALALCRAHRLAVRATRVRLKSLEELVLDAHDRAAS